MKGKFFRVNKLHGVQKSFFKFSFLNYNSCDNKTDEGGVVTDGMCFLSAVHVSQRDVIAKILDA
jgi:hypothetical protein